ncbi:MAG: thiamine-phosphate kinase [Thermoproteota archaeon]
MTSKKKSRGVGERKIIEILRGHLDLPSKMGVPFGDDVSTYEWKEGKMAVLKTDMLVDKTDVPHGMSLGQAARKAVVMNVSDFAAKGVKPLAILASLGLPREVTREDVEEIGRGLNAGAREYGSYIIGGDTNEASDMVISLSVFGVSRKEDLILRSGARPGDMVGVTGLFGVSSAGLKILIEDLEVPKDIRKPLVKSVLMPHARLKEGLALAKTGSVTAGIDSSDGLAWSLHRIANASNVGVLIDNIPIAEEVKRFAKNYRLDPLNLTFYGGEEYELVLTIKSDLWGTAEKAVERVDGKLIPIGEVTEGKNVQLETKKGREILEDRGWEHFKKIDR